MNGTRQKGERVHFHFNLFGFGRVLVFVFCLCLLGAFLLGPQFHISCLLAIISTARTSSCCKSTRALSSARIPKAAGLSGILHAADGRTDAAHRRRRGADALRRRFRFTPPVSTTTFPSRPRRTCGFCASPSKPVFDDFMGFVNDLNDLNTQIDRKDHYTYHHSRRVMRFARPSASARTCPPRRRTRCARRAVSRRRQMLPADGDPVKPGRLTDSEYAAMKRHPIDSFNLLSARFSPDAPDCARPPRAAGWKRLPGRADCRPDVAGNPHPFRCGYLRRDDLRPAV